MAGQNEVRLDMAVHERKPPMISVKIFFFSTLEGDLVFFEGSA